MRGKRIAAAGMRKPTAFDGLNAYCLWATSIVENAGSILLLAHRKRRDEPPESPPMQALARFMPTPSFDILAPLGSATVLVGAAASAALAADGENYRIGFAGENGKVPLFGDLRFLGAVAGYAYANFAPSHWPAHDIARLGAFTSVASLAVTEGIRAKETDNLWGLDLSKFPSVSDIPFIGKWFGGAASTPPAAAPTGAVDTTPLPTP